MNWKRNIIIVALIGVAAFGMWRAFQPYDAQADAGDGDQVFAHSVIAAILDSTEIANGGLGSEDYADGSIEAAHLNLVGDSVSVFATKTNVYSDSVVFGDTASIVIDHLVIGDSVAVTATALKCYGDFYLADCGVDSMSIDGDSSQVITCSAVLADTTACVIFIQEMTDPVGNWYRKHQFAGGFGIMSDGTETGLGWFYWIVLRKAE